MHTKDKEECKPGEPEPENATNSVQTEKAGETSGEGPKEQRQNKSKKQKF